MGQLAVRLGEEWPTSRGEHRKDWKERRVHLEAKGQGPQGAEEGIWVSAFPGHGGWAEKPRELWGEEQPLLVFSDCFSSFRKEERVSCHQNQEKEASPSTAWHKAHCHITSHYPKPFPSPSPCPPTADSSFLPSLTPQSPHSPESSPDSSVTPPPPRALVLLQAAVLQELRTHCHYPCKSLGPVRCSRQPSILPCTPTDP